MGSGCLEALNQSAHLCLCPVDHRKVQLRGWRMTLLHAEQFIFIKMPTVSCLKTKPSVTAFIWYDDQSSLWFYYSVTSTYYYLRFVFFYDSLVNEFVFKVMLSRKSVLKTKNHTVAKKLKKTIYFLKKPLKYL